MKVFKAVVKTVIPLTAAFWLNPYAQQLLLWAGLLFVVVVGIVCVSLIVFVYLALTRENVRKALIGLIKAVKH